MAIMKDNESTKQPFLKTITIGFRRKIAEHNQGRQNGLAINPWNFGGKSNSRESFNAEKFVDTLSVASRSSGISATAYDTAWLASLSLPTNGQDSGPLYLTALQWLLDKQWPDGSWGGAVRYEHDRILSTLVALSSIAAHDVRGEYSSVIANGTRYLWQHGHILSSEPVELVAFELLLPTLVKRAQDAGICVPPHLDVYRAERAEKLRLIPAGTLYSPRVTLVHSLEFLGEQADLSGFYAAQGANGAIGNSPAATAFFYELSQDARALAYLDKFLADSNDTGVPVLHPCETYELLWAAYHLYLAGIPISRLLSSNDREFLKQALRTGGVSLSPSFPIPDADDTAVALIFLHEIGEKCDPHVLRGFELPEGYFASFPYERHSSVGVNLHVLHALIRVPGYKRAGQIVDKLLDYIASKQIGGLYWLDKWHISPYYATTHALCVMSDLPPVKRARMGPLMKRAREWICQTQNSDGSWGFYNQPTIEETAFALLALTASAVESLSTKENLCCTAAAHYLQQQIELSDEKEDSLLPPLWIDKCLYTPKLIVLATVQSALAAYRSMALTK